MDPIIILPVALAVAWAASRKKKTTKKTTTTSTTTPTKTPTPTTAEPSEQPPPTEQPKGPFDGPGGEEPWRPGGPDVDGPKGPEPFPGPSGGPKDPAVGDPSPIEIYPGTTAAEIDAQDNAPAMRPTSFPRRRESRAPPSRPAVRRPGLGKPPAARAR